MIQIGSMLPNLGTPHYDKDNDHNDAKRPILDILMFNLFHLKLLEVP